jgi:Major intrinsic protein
MSVPCLEGARDVVARPPVRSLGAGRRVTGRLDRVEFRLRPRAAGDWGAEAVGTAVLVLGALSAVAFVLGEGSPLAELPMSLRLAITGVLVGVCVALIAVSPLGRLSGAHINPAVTLRFWIVRMVPLRDLVGYIGAQLAGAVVGAYLFRWSWGHVALSVAGGVTHPSVSMPRRPSARGRNDGAAYGVDPAVRLTRADHAVDAPDARAAARAAGLAGLLLRARA